MCEMRFRIRTRNQQHLFTLWLVFFLTICAFPCAAPDSPAQDSLKNKDIPCEWSEVKRIVAVGDLHGAYEYFELILKGTGLIDEGLHWIGGDTHLVQIGDVLDRGDGARQIFDLARQLEKEAEAAGGRVHMLIGNHEEMNLAGTAFEREGYITPNQFVDFISDEYRANREKVFSRKAARKSSGDSSANGYDPYWKEILDEIRETPPEFKHKGRDSYLKTFNELYGDWILSHNVVIKINDVIFVHGGISLAFSEWSLKEINDQYRKELNDVRWGVLRGSDYRPVVNIFERVIYNEPGGPLWYRGLAQEETEVVANELTAILENLGGKHMVIAHTPQIQLGVDIAKYGGRVYVIDTGIADYYKTIGGYIAALIINNGQFQPWYPPQDKREESRQGKQRHSEERQKCGAENSYFEGLKSIFYSKIFIEQGE